MDRLEGEAKAVGTRSVDWAAHFAAIVVAMSFFITASVALSYSLGECQQNQVTSIVSPFLLQYNTGEWCSILKFSVFHMSKDRFLMGEVVECGFLLFFLGGHWG